MDKIDISGLDPAEYGRVLAHTNMYKIIYGCDVIDDRLDLIRAAAGDRSPEIINWLKLVKQQAANIQAKACDFSDAKQLHKDEEDLAETEDFLVHQSDLLPCQVYSVRDLALIAKHQGLI